MSPRLGRGSVDYNLAMDPALLNAGKVVAAAEDRKLAELLRFLLRQHIERHGSAEAQNIYEASRGMSHGTPIARGSTKRLAVQVPEELVTRLEAQAAWEERHVASLVRKAVEHYLQEAQADETRQKSEA